VSLVNLLGQEMCPYVCLVPCCLPRVVRSARIPRATETNDIDKSINDNKHHFSSNLQVYLHENDEQRQKRLNKLKVRDQRRNRNSVCYICQSKDHLLHQCSQFINLLDTEQKQLVKDFSTSRPCWECGNYGHFKASCPIRASNRDYNESKMIKENDLNMFLEPPIKRFDINNLFKEPDPILAYCHLLSAGFEWWNASHSKQIVQTGLTTNSAKGLKGCDSKNNWNKHRKSIYIIVG
jgi:Zinc knuckle